MGIFISTSSASRPSRDRHNRVSMLSTTKVFSRTFVHFASLRPMLKHLPYRSKAALESGQAYWNGAESHANGKPFLALKSKKIDAATSQKFFRPTVAMFSESH